MALRRREKNDKNNFVVLHEMGRDGSRRMAAESRVYIWNVFCCLQIILCDTVIVVWVTRFMASLYKLYVGMVSLLKVFMSHNRQWPSVHYAPRAGSGVVRMDPLRFLAGCRTRRLNQA